MCYIETILHKTKRKRKKENFLTHFAVLVKFDVPLSDDFAFVVVAVVQLHTVAAVLQLGRNHCACEYKSMYASQ